jgi:hypothetical protein
VQTTSAIKNDGAVWGWGNNSEGQLGNGTYVNQPTPVLISTVCVTPLANDSFTMNKRNISLYPNPTQDSVTLTYDLVEDNALLYVYDVTGRLMTEKNIDSKKGEINMDTSTYEAGIYIVVLKQNNKIINQQKLIKK